MPTNWSKQGYLQGFDWESITFKKAVHMIESMEIAESIYRGVVEHSYKKPTWEDANRAGNIRHKRAEAASAWTRPEKGESSGKRIKQHLDSSTGKSKTCLIHGPRNYPEECKVLGDFGTSQANIRPTKYRRSNPITRKKN